MSLTREIARPLAYSYVRFSTARQELGDSLRRQVEMAEVYCKENNLDLQPLSFRDLGVSAFKRKNIETGALACFIGAVESGTISRGSYLVIEQFDRLSRADVDIALMLLLRLVNAGITVVTIADNKIWNKSTVKDLTNLIVAILYMSKANFESVDTLHQLAACSPAVFFVKVTAPAHRYPLQPR